MGCACCKQERRARDDEVPQVSRRERRLWLRALSCCFKGNPSRGYWPLTETLEPEDPKLKEHELKDHPPTHHEDLQQKLGEKEAEVQQFLESELQTRITDLEGQITVLQGQIADLDDAKDKLIAAKDQELQDERRQLLKRITTQQEDHKQRIAEKEAEVQHLQQSVKQQEAELQTKITVLEGQIVILQDRITDLEDAKDKLITAKEHLQQSLEEKEAELQTKITDLEGQIATLHSQIADLEDAKDKLIAAKDQELQDERAQLLKCITTQEDYKQEIVEKETEVQHLQQSLEQKEAELQTKITDLEGQIAVLQGQITDLEDAKDKLIAAKEQELQDERRQLLKCITTQQEDHKKKIDEKEAEVQLLQQSLEQQKGQLQELQAVLSPAEQEQAESEPALKDLDTELNKVHEWFRFGLNLGVSASKLQEIQETKRGEVAACRLDALIVWVDMEKPTWGKVVRALLAMGRKRLAGDLAKKYGVPLPQNVDDISLQHMASTSTQEGQLQSVKEMEKEVADKEGLLKQSQFSEASLEGEVKENMEILPRLQSQLKLVVHEKNHLEKQLETECRNSQLLHELYVLEHEKSQGKEEVKELFASLIKEKEHHISRLKDEVEAKEKQITSLLQELEETKAELSQKTKELEEVTKQVQKLEREKEQLRCQWVARNRTLDRKLQQQVAKTTSQAAYNQLVNTRLSTAMEMVVSKDKEAADYRQQISQKEGEITVLYERIQHQEAELHRMQMESRGTTVDQASSKETLEAFHKEVSQMVDTSELKMELLRAEKEKQRLELKEETTLQEAKCHQEEISLLSLDPMKCTAVGPGLESAKKNQLAHFEVHLVVASGDTYKYINDSEISVQLKCFGDDSVTKVNTSKKDQAIYSVSYEPTKPGKHEIAVTVNDAPIHGSPFQVFVHNHPHPENCTTVGSGWELTETKELTKFEVHLADIDGDPCVINQDVIAKLKSLVDGSQVKAKVVSKTPAIYEVSYQPTIRGRHDLSVRVNGMPIQGSPFRVYVRQPPCLMRELEIDIEHYIIEDITTTGNGDIVMYGDNKLLFYTRNCQRIKTIQLHRRKNDISRSRPTSRIAVDSSDNVYVVTNQYAHHHLFKFNSTGNLEKSHHHFFKFNSTGELDSMEQKQELIVNPRGIVLSKENKIYVCYRKDCRIKTFDTDLNFIGSFGSDEIRNPIDMAIDSDGNLYVADCAGACVHVLSQSGTYLRKIGSQDEVSSVHVDHGWVYCTSLKNNSMSVHVHTTAGESIGSFDTNDVASMYAVSSATMIDEDGFVYIACSTWFKTVLNVY